MEGICDPSGDERRRGPLLAVQLVLQLRRDPLQVAGHVALTLHRVLG